MTTPTALSPLALEVASCAAVGGRTHIDGTVWALPFGLQVAALWSAEDLAWEVLLLDPEQDQPTRMALVTSRERAEVIARASWLAGLGLAADAAQGA